MQKELHMRLVNSQRYRRGQEDALRRPSAQLSHDQRINTLRRAHAAVMHRSIKSLRQVTAQVLQVAVDKGAPVAAEQCLV
jgi:hypothetical protein